MQDSSARYSFRTFFAEAPGIHANTPLITGVVCGVRVEEIADPLMQKIRYLEAARASYHYNNHLFIAEDVKLWKYQVEGHQPPEEISGLAPLMTATAASVEFTLRGKKMDFVAHKMRATVNSKEREL